MARVDAGGGMSCAMIPSALDAALGLPMIDAKWPQVGSWRTEPRRGAVLRRCARSTVDSRTSTREDTCAVR